MNEIDQLKVLLKELSKKDVNLLVEAWSEVIKKGYLKYLPKICQNSYVRSLKVSDYIDYISDENEPIEDRYAKYFRMLFEINNLEFLKEMTKERLTEIYYKLLQESITKFGFINCEYSSQNKLNDRIYLFTNQYLPNSNHSPSVLLEKLYLGLKEHFKQIFIISSTPYAYAYPDKDFKLFIYSNVDENSLYKLDNNVFYIEFRGYLSESIYLDFVKHQNFTSNDKFLLVGHSSIHFDLIKSNNKILLPTGMVTLKLSNANYLLVADDSLKYENIFNDEYQKIKISADFTKKGNYIFNPKKLFKTINIAIVGNRLDVELDVDFFEMLVKIKKTISNVRFEIIGNFSNKNLISKELSESMYFIEYISDLSDYFSKNTNFFLNPKRIGGGQSSVMAFKVGVPVISLPFGDVYECLEKKYCVNSYEEIPDFIKNYTLNEEFKNEIDKINKDLAMQSEEKFNSMIQKILDIN